MNEYAEIIINERGYYSNTKYSSWSMFVFADFFIQDVDDSIKYWLERLKEPNDRLFGAGGNWSSLEKDENGYVFIIDSTTSRIYEDKIIPEEMILRIKPDELIKLLYKWEELYAHRVPEIMITKDGDDFEMFEVIK